MQKGRIIFLNGVTSSGKTSIAEALQERKDIFFYVVANDLFEQMVGDKYLQEDYWKYLSEVIIMMYHTAKLYSDMGKNVLIDGILVEREEIKPHYEQQIGRASPLSEESFPVFSGSANVGCSSTAGTMVFSGTSGSEFSITTLVSAANGSGEPGNSTVNTVPSPSRLDTVMVPWCLSTIDLANARPIPVLL